MRRAVLLFVLLVVALGGLLGFRVLRDRRAAEGPPGGSGVVEGTSVDLRARINARVLTRHVEEGARVDKGALLVTLDCTEPEAGLVEAQARLSMSQAQADAAKAAAQAAIRNSEAVASQAAGSQAQIGSLADQQGLAKRQAERLEKMGAATTEAALDQARAQAASLEQQLAAARHSSTAAGRQARAAAEQQHASLRQAESALRAVEAAEAALSRARVTVAECELRAPMTGTVETLALEEGELALPGAVVARLVDTRRPKATFYLPNAELAAAKPGQEATVRADAYPDQTFPARVVTVSREAAFTPRNVQTRSDRDRLVYPVEVHIDAPEGLLLPGMPVEISLSAIQERAVAEQRR
ncbi:HlyD family efflux transporter periplasmic adaptor subunit [Pyxidicoccus fallax]|uniref:HlyD family efflux transporter periplasmic adaptor subunit n=1 Tax=Pyxidicoccus fallax TaxID=394095 RepID=A0A848LR43_9BACT|nr:HlyD family efflux transporter periplasmic adaptor subunit [Pyxidicoccus fallax]NMO20110.1 HlyD family efflux transporter periplasmic adaptor subunit [Pyxidicoccus fallax]NPC86550.1 HlyD family efflux transporter periplasmic adaptor subunit [Pyxidicoccus fallax]